MALCCTINHIVASLLHYSFRLFVYVMKTCVSLHNYFENMCQGGSVVMVSRYREHFTEIL